MRAFFSLCAFLLEREKKSGHKCRLPFIIGAIQTEKYRIMKQISEFLTQSVGRTKKAAT